MKKMILAALALAMCSFALIGCHAEGSVDPHGATSITAPR
jgi:hypothetical protein